jgi:hypothetical protein
MSARLALSAPGFYEDALARGKHRDIVGGRWEETALHQMQVILDEGLEPHDHFLDIGCGCLRLGPRWCPILTPAITGAPIALMLRGHETELTAGAQARLPKDHLVEDADFRFPGLPHSISFALCWGVFTHLPAAEPAPLWPI